MAVLFLDSRVIIHVDPRYSCITLRQRVIIHVDHRYSCITLRQPCNNTRRS
jgi:hypothetical protein